MNTQFNFLTLLGTNKLVEFGRLLKDLGSKVSEELIVLMPNLLTTLRHPDLYVVKQSISSGTALFGAVLEEIALQVLFVEQLYYYQNLTKLFM